MPGADRSSGASTAASPGVGWLRTCQGSCASSRTGSRRVGSVNSVRVHLPPALAELLSCDRQVEVRGHTVGDALRDLVAKQPGLALHLFDDAGSLRRLVLCFCNQDQVRGAEGLARVLRTGDSITIMGSVAGGWIRSGSDVTPGRACRGRGRRGPTSGPRGGSRCDAEPERDRQSSAGENR